MEGGGCGSCGSHGCRDKKTCCDIANLIYQSMVGCYARDRRSAIHRMSDRYDCCCHPEIMNALIYALNDSDERVRGKAADEIGDQIRRNRVVCGAPVICALRSSLADCDPYVRRQAKEALEFSGYRIVNGCCQSNLCCADQSTDCLSDANTYPVPAIDSDSTPTPVPADESTLPQQETLVPDDVVPAPLESESIESPVPAAPMNAESVRSATSANGHSKASGA